MSFAGNAAFSSELAGTKKEAEASLFNAERKCHAQKNASSRWGAIHQAIKSALRNL
jgi:hypothetical protein